ncbi:MAG: ankyrin repeat domain-containing protein [Puniceicoccales bacterium]|jgi:ankyrin repeat protein|nr:ankyrin repeat domain-containing protein [Puniceicoccales bacterium]
MKKSNTKNIIKYAAIGGCLLSTGRLYGTLLWRDSNGDLVAIDVNTVDVNLRGQYDATPLLRAADEGDLEAVRILINRGAAMDVQDIDGGTPLHWAAVNGHLKVARFLIEEKGAAIDVQDSMGMRPLHWAALWGRLAVVRFLIANGAAVNALNNISWTPLHYAARIGHLEVARFLIENDAAVNALDDKGQTPLDLAWREETKDFLRSAGGKTGDEIKASVNLRNEINATPLHTAAEVDDLEAVKILINRGAAVDARDDWGMRPLHRAAYYGHLEVARFLIEEKGAAIDVQDMDGETPLHCATMNGYLEVARVLIANGADVNVLDDDGRTPLDWNRDEAIKDLLRSAGGKTGDEIRNPRKWYQFWK